MYFICQSFSRFHAMATRNPDQEDFCPESCGFCVLSVKKAHSVICGSRVNQETIRAVIPDDDGAPPLPVKDKHYSKVGFNGDCWNHAMATLRVRTSTGLISLGLSFDAGLRDAVLNCSLRIT